MLVQRTNKVQQIEPQPVCGNYLMTRSFNEKKEHLLKQYNIQETKIGKYYYQYCKACHGIERQKIGPSLYPKVISQNKWHIDSLLKNNIENLEHIIIELNSDSEIDSIIDYVKYLKIRNDHTMESH